MNMDNILLGSFVAVEGVHAFSAFLPSIFTIKTFVKDEEGRDMIREGELCAVVFVAALGAIVSKLSDNLWPLILAGVAAAMMVGVYEYALFRAPVNNHGYDGQAWEG